MDITESPDWLRLQLEADAAVAVDQLLKAGPAACDEYLASIKYAQRLERLHELQAAQ